MNELLQKINWVDVLTAVLLIRIVYISAKTGFVVEFMKMLGAILAAFFAFHYYAKLALFISKSTNMDVSSLETVSFGVLWLALYVVCILVRNGLFLVFTVETLSLIDRWGAAVASLVRFLLTISMLMFIFLLTDNAYMEKMTMSSFSQKYVLESAPKVYYWMFEAVVVKFFPDQKANKSVAEELGKAAAQ